MNTILENEENVECFMDDILIHSDTKEKLETITQRAIKKLHDAGLRLNKEKCIFTKKEIKFLGNSFTPNGIKPDKEKVEAIKKLKTPTNKTELQRLLGTINYLARFIKDHSKLTEPLRRLLTNGVAWQWESEQDRAVNTLKERLAKLPLLAYYDVNKKVKLTVDASSIAIGAVLTQNDRPIAYATKSLTNAQKAYPQIEKEALAIKFGCSKFHQYIYGKRLIIETDHKPFEIISRKPLHTALPRLQRLLFDVSQYGPKIIYRKGEDIPVADILSRDCEEHHEKDEETMEILVIMPLSQTVQEKLKDETNNDEEMRALKNIINIGWPDRQKDLPLNTAKYWNFRDELSCYNDILFKNDRPIIPKSLRRKYLENIHIGHFGINGSIRSARDAIYWYGMTQDITEVIRRCEICECNQRNNPKEPLIIRKIPSLPWQIAATDIFEYDNKMFLMIVDSYSGYIDFARLNEINSKQVIGKLKIWFSTHGVPEELWSDNGT